MTYAKGTTVEVSASQQEIARTLARYKVDTYTFGQRPGAAGVSFQIGVLPIRMEVPLPPRPTQQRIMNKDTGRMVLAEPRWEQEIREAWRSLLLLIKANLEAIERKITTPERAFMAYLVLPDGRDLGDAVLPAFRALLRRRAAGAGVRQVTVTFSRRRLKLYRGFTITHATADGGPVLKGESSWRTVDGFLINTPLGHLAVSRRGVA